MTALLPLTFAGTVYDRTQRLFTGEVRPQGVDLRCFALSIEELFWRQGTYGEFDVAEFSLGAYLASVDDVNRRFLALPVFLSRAFRHSALYVRTGSEIRTVDDLTGGRIGTPEWSMSASLWMRGILGEHYGLDLAGISWFTGGLDEAGRQEKSKVHPPDRFRVEHIGAERTLSEMLFDGELDALIAARAPRAFLSGDGRVRRLFERYEDEELSYFQATRIVPIMHLVVVRRELVECHPWLANSLRTAFEQARRPSLVDLRDNAVSQSSLVWEASYAAREQSLLGDVFVNGVAQNRAALDAILRYAYEQGFSSSPLALGDVFEPSTLTDARV